MHTLTKIFTFFLVLLSSIIFFCPAAYAIRATNLYTAQIIVPTSGAKIRELALPEALKQVLIKVSGKTDIAKAPGISEKLNSARALVDSYGYLKRTNETGTKNLYLQVKFDQKDIHALLDQARQPIWLDNRPLILAWLVTPNLSAQEDQQVMKILATSGMTDPFSQALRTNAMRLGLPLSLPNMDLQDVTAISAANICNFDTKTLQIASRRYAADAILAGCVTEEPDKTWRGGWLMIANDKVTRWNVAANDINSLVGKEMDNVFADLTQTFATSINGLPTQPIILHISHIDGLGEYTQVIKYVRKLNSVTKVHLMKIEPDGILLSVVNKGGVRVLQNALRSGNKLIVDPNTVNPQPTPPLLALNTATPNHLTAPIVPPPSSTLTNNHNSILPQQNTTPTPTTITPPATAATPNTSVSATTNEEKATTNEPITLYYQWVKDRR